MCALINTEISECGLQDALSSDMTVLFKNIEDVKHFISLEFYDQSKEMDTLKLLLRSFESIQWFEACNLIKNKINNLC